MPIGEKVRITVVEEDSNFASLLIGCLNSSPKLVCVKHIGRRGEFVGFEENDLILINVQDLAWLDGVCKIDPYLFCVYNKNDFFTNKNKSPNHRLLRQFLKKLEQKLFGRERGRELLPIAHGDELFPILTNSRIEFVRLTEIVAFEADLLSLHAKVKWVVRLFSGETKKLNGTMLGADILKFSRYFVRVNRVTIINLLYLQGVNFEERKGFLFSAVTPYVILFSPKYILELRRRFDLTFE